MSTKNRIFGFLVVLAPWALIIAAVLIWGCDSADTCGNPGSTKCEDNTVMYCTTGNEWIVENKCHTVTMLDGSQHPGQCCEGYGLSYCAEECGVSDAGTK